MNAPPVDSLVWSPRKLIVVIILAVLVQVALIAWCSAPGVLTPRAAEARPEIQLLAGARSEWLSLTDPTLFSRAHPDGFSGHAWLAVPEHNYLPGDKADAPLWLALTTESLGGAFREFVKGYTPEGLTLRSWQPPVVTGPTRRLAAVGSDSEVRVEGPLARRGIRSVPMLPAWTNNDILAPSRVRVLVDAAGHPMSAVLLESSGLKAADASAVELAQRMTFGRDEEALRQPPGNPDAGLATGRLIFSWRTLAPVTNGLVNPR